MGKERSSEKTWEAYLQEGGPSLSAGFKKTKPLYKIFYMLKLNLRQIDQIVTILLQCVKLLNKTF